MLFPQFSFRTCLLISALLTFTSCSYILDTFTDPEYEVVDLEGKKKLGIVFSHNVNGETHPCGCRHFPLGGLPQVAGALEKLKKDEIVIYVDTGDTLFPTGRIPDSLVESQTYNAIGLAEGLSKVGLRYWVPGDQDFAKGIDFLQSIVNKTKIMPVLSNLHEGKLKLPHKKMVAFEKGPHKIFILGIVNPALLPSAFRSLFKDPLLSIKENLKTLKEKGYSAKNPFHRLVIMSHSGIGQDEKFAKAYPEIDWIIGAHTMNFLRFPQEEGNTKIVQVLSRNHYLGHISFSLSSGKKEDQYNIIEVRDELKDELDPNPYLAFIDKHKEALSKIQKEEQSEIMKGNLGVIKYSTYNSCIECHEPQADFWQGTSHALAYHTLITAKEPNNLECIQCHSLGLGEEKGFSRVQDMLEFDETYHGKFIGKEKEELTQKYWNELKEAFGPVKSVRDLATKERKKLAKKWEKHDQSFHVNRNFANVQCLNCHIQHDNHPFESLDPPMQKDQKIAKMKNKCLQCHNSDQSPQWYSKQENGLPGPINRKKLDAAFVKVSCPSMKE